MLFLPDAVLRDEVAEGAAVAEGTEVDEAAVGGTMEATPPVLLRPIVRLLTGPRVDWAEAALTEEDEGGTGAL